jgi:hypothetical protein
VLVTRDILGRRSQVVALDVVNILYHRDGSATATIGRTNTNSAGERTDIHLLPGTVIHLKRWLVAADITEGAIFRAVTKSGRIGARLGRNEVVRVVKRVAEQAGLAPNNVARISREDPKRR